MSATTIETQQDNYLPFLDALVTRQQDGSLSHQVFCKKASTNEYLHAGKI